MVIGTVGSPFELVERSIFLSCPHDEMLVRYRFVGVDDAKTSVLPAFDEFLPSEQVGGTTDILFQISTLISSPVN